MFGASLEAVATGLAALFAVLHEAGGQNGHLGGELFLAAVKLTADEGGVSGDAHAGLPGSGVNSD
jgi:hypothetical protein